MRVNRPSNGLVVFVALLSIFIPETHSDTEPVIPKAEEYDYKPPGYPGSATNEGMFF